MSETGKASARGDVNAAGEFQRWSRLNKVDFEIDFLERLVRRDPCYVDALRPLAELLTLRKAYRRGLEVDLRLARLRPEDPLVRYNLACSFALVRATREAMESLRKAIELGYDDFEFMAKDPDLEGLHGTADFQQLLKEQYQRLKKRRRRSAS